MFNLISGNQFKLMKFHYVAYLLKLNQIIHYNHLILF